MIHFDLPKLKQELESLEAKTSESNFWEDTKKSAPILQEIKSKKNKIENFNSIKRIYDDIETLIELGIIEEDASVIDEVNKLLKQLEKELEKFEIVTLLSGKYDKNNAIITLHPGARWY